MAKALAKGSRITGTQRSTLSAQYAKRYAAGDSVRQIADESGRSYGFVHGVLKESGLTLRGRGGATRGKTATTGSARKSTAKKVPASKTATKTVTAPTKSAAKAAAKTVKKAPAKTAAAAKEAAAKTATTKKAAAKKAAARKS